MAEIKTSIDYELGLTIHTVSGSFTTQELIQTLEDYYKGFPTKMILWDFSKGDWKNINNEELKDAANKATKYTRPGGKTALVFTNKGDFGIGRMLKTFFKIGEYDFEAKSFISQNDAEKWLGL